MHIEKHDKLNNQFGIYTQVPYTKSINYLSHNLFWTTYMYIPEICI